MKSPLLIGVSALVLLASATLLFAQTTTGSSLITQMKAATHAFTLTADLNSGATGLESSPLVGKRTGDMLSAGEYNRILELVGQGGGGAGWVDVPLTDTADFDVKCDYIFNGLRATFVHPEIIGFIKNEFDATSAASWYAVRKANKNTMINHQDNYANNTIYPTQPITSITKNCGGGSTEQGYIEPGFENFPKEVVCTYNGSNNKIKFKLESFYNIDNPSSAMAYYLTASTIDRWTMIVGYKKIDGSRYFPVALPGIVCPATVARDGRYTQQI